MSKPEANTHMPRVGRSVRSVQRLWRSYDEAVKIVTKGYPAVADLLPELVEWAGDGNDSGHGLICDFLVSIGRPVIPYVKAALGDPTLHTEWKFCILSGVVRRWDAGMTSEIAAELKRLAYGWDVDGANAEAIRLLARHGLEEPDALLRIVWNQVQSGLLSLADLVDASSDIRGDAPPPVAHIRNALIRIGLSIATLLKGSTDDANRP